MIRTNVYVTKKQYETLKKLAREGLSMAEHIRRAIDLYLKMLGKEQKL
jgi:hypothetical protein